MPLSRPIDGFRLSYDDSGTSMAGNAPVLLLHGWPGDRTDYRAVTPLLTPDYRVVVPDLRGYGDSDRHLDDPNRYYSPVAHAASIAALIDELGLGKPIVGGYDIGGRVAQVLTHDYPDHVGALVLSPPLPGSGRRVLAADLAPATWYQHFHRSGLSTTMIDGQPQKVHAYLRYFWELWSGPEFPVDTPEFSALVDRYARPGAFQAATNWSRVGDGYLANASREDAPAPHDRIAIPTRVLWPQLDPLFPPEWADRIDEFFSDVAVDHVDGIGHFTPLEAPAEFAAAVRSVLPTDGVDDGTLPA